MQTRGSEPVPRNAPPHGPVDVSQLEQGQGHNKGVAVWSVRTTNDVPRCLPTTPVCPLPAICFMALSWHQTVKKHLATVAVVARHGMGFFSCICFYSCDSRTEMCVFVQ